MSNKSSSGGFGGVGPLRGGESGPLGSPRRAGPLRVSDLVAIRKAAVRRYDAAAGHAASLYLKGKHAEALIALLKPAQSGALLSDLLEVFAARLAELLSDAAPQRLDDSELPLLGQVTESLRLELDD